MKRIIIVVEGQTEREFVYECIAPYLKDNFDLFSVSARLIGGSNHKGGRVVYQRLQNDINKLLHEPEVIVSTFIDYFKLQSDFPDFQKCKKITNIDLRIDKLEQAIELSIGDKKFIPYIQKHEFEALLFSDTQRFGIYLSPAICKELEKISKQFANPETINDKNPPSYRLDDIFKRCQPKQTYKKVAFGNILALQTGIDAMLNRCPRFAAWVVRLVDAAQH
jgi:hypothetical protein